MPKKSEFFSDIIFFDEEFNGIVPIEVIIDTRRKGGAQGFPHSKGLTNLNNILMIYLNFLNRSHLLVVSNLSNKPTTMAIPTTTNFPHRRKILSLLGILRILKVLKD